MSTAQTLRSSFQRLAQAWPRDALRPTMQFPNAISAASDRIFSATPPQDLQAAQQQQSAQQDVTRAPSAATRPLGDRQLAKAQATIDSLERMLGDDALRRYPMTQKTSAPASFPKHYARIKEGAERAARGDIVKRQRWKQFFQWK